MPQWTMDDIPWDRFDAKRVDSDILKVIKAAAMVERNAADYTAYLGNVFHDDPAFLATVEDWGVEEEQHGDVLGRWAELADPTFDYQAAFARFRAGYRIDVEATTSIRGSRTGELVARCIVETGTSSFYSALRDASDEPVLKAICHRIAGDEFRHFKTFYKAINDYQQREPLGIWRRLMIGVGRIKESDDDELAYAYFAANASADAVYKRADSSLDYGARAFACYRPPHIRRAANMVLKSSGINPQGWFGAAFGHVMAHFVGRHARRLSSALAARPN